MDTTGSIIEPSSRAALFGMRASVGLIPGQISSRYQVQETLLDQIPIGKSAYDAALLLGGMIDHVQDDSTSESKPEE